MSAISHSRQVVAVEAIIAIFSGAKKAPRPAEKDMLLQDARAALETLRRLPDTGARA